MEAGSSGVDKTRQQQATEKTSLGGAKAAHLCSFSFKHNPSCVQCWAKRSSLQPVIYSLCWAAAALKWEHKVNI